MVDGAPLRVVFFGTPRFAVPTLDRLLASDHLVAGVVTQPDRPRGRGQKTTDAPVKARALEAHLPVLQPSTLKHPDALASIAELRPDIGVVAAYGKILPQTLLDLPRLGMVNVHASLLPRHRGAAPVHRAVLAGDEATGVTIMRVVLALDAGPLLAVIRRPIGEDDTSEQVEHDLAEMGAGLLVATLDRLARGPIPEQPQDDQFATYASRLTKEDGLMDWSRPSGELHNLIRGLHPWPHAFAFLRGRLLILLRASHLQGDTHPLPGTVVAASGDDLRIATGAGVLRIQEIQAEGKRPMTSREFLAGHRVVVGDRLTTHP